MISSIFRFVRPCSYAFVRSCGRTCFRLLVRVFVRSCGRTCFRLLVRVFVRSYVCADVIAFVRSCVRAFVFRALVFSTFARSFV